MNEEKKCADLVRGAYRSRMADITKLWEMDCEGELETDPELGRFE